MNTYQEPKYMIKEGKIVNRQSGEAIPEDEPIFILRARDHNALGALAAYLSLCSDLKHKEAVRQRHAQFANWAALHQDRLKEPDTQITNDWTTAGAPSFGIAAARPVKRGGEPIEHEGGPIKRDAESIHSAPIGTDYTTGTDPAAK